MPFHKSCYTSRSSGYKYRTLSTDTGDRKKLQRPSIQQEVSAIDQKFHILHDDISVLINKELNDTDKSRGIRDEKFDKIDAKINAMLELRDNLMSMRKTLTEAEETLGDLYQRVQRIEVMSEVNNVKLRKIANRPRPVRAVPVEEAEQEIYSSEMIASPVVAS